MADESEQPGFQEPFSQLMASAVTFHELFRSFVDAGFTEDQALTLLVTVMQTSTISNLLGGQSGE